MPPPPGNPEQTVAQKLEAQLAEYLAMREEWEGGFKRTAKGNLTRTYAGARLTVFTRPDGRYGWAVADDDGVRYSQSGYGDEDDALGGLWDAVEG
jgi:hypothetical protein